MAVQITLTTDPGYSFVVATTGLPFTIVKCGKFPDRLSPFALYSGVGDSPHKHTRGGYA